MNLPAYNSKEYWTEYYKQQRTLEPSHFARFAVSSLDKTRPVLDIGTGNGRDALYFARRGFVVHAVDLAYTGVMQLQEQLDREGIIDAEAVCCSLDDLVEHPLINETQYGSIYARFFLHAISATEQNKFLSIAKSKLVTGGNLFIEARTTKDKKYGLGTKISDTEYLDPNDGHYRRFICSEELSAQLSSSGFDTLSRSIGYFSTIENDNPVLLRIVARKQ